MRKEGRTLYKCVVLVCASVPQACHRQDMSQERRSTRNRLADSPPCHFLISSFSSHAYLPGRGCRADDDARWSSWWLLRKIPAFVILRNFALVICTYLFIKQVPPTSATSSPIHPNPYRPYKQPPIHINPSTSPFNSPTSHNFHSHSTINSSTRKIQPPSPSHPHLALQHKWQTQLKPHTTTNSTSP